MKRILMIAFHFPPQAGSSGVQRTLRFVQHLPALGWQPLVLTAGAKAYERTSDDLTPEIPAGTVVRRAFALDAARHLSVAGHYLQATALPDRWNSWRFDGVRRGMQMIREFEPDIVWSTFPIATAHNIAFELHKKSNIPWVADFRDPMVQPGYPAIKSVRRAYERVESRLMKTAQCCVFTTPGARQRYQERYPDCAARWEVIENGYDESSFNGLARQASDEGPLVVLHSGIVYPQERDPAPLMRALALLKASGVSPARLKLRFRAAVHDDLLKDLARTENVSDFIELGPPIAYRPALQEMLNAGALLVMQAARCNDQIPGKLYEYFRTGRPIIGVTDFRGDTAAALRTAGVPYLANCDEPNAIAGAFQSLLKDHESRTVVCPSRAAADSAARHARSAQFASLLDQISGGSANIVR